MKKLFTLLIILTFTMNVNAQKNEPAKAFISTQVTSMTHVTSIASRPQDQLAAVMSEETEMQDERSKNQPKIIIGKDPQRTNDYFTLNPNALEQKVKGKAPSLVFDAASSNSQPTDPSLAVGPNHVFVVYNTGFRIFAKDGTALTSQTAPNPAIFPSGGCCDLTVSYDNLADRWVVTFLGGGMQVAVSDGPDPINDGWYVYNVAAVSDYNKLSVWRDGYYVTQNVGGATKVFALERDKMLLGDPAAQVIGFSMPGIVTSGFHSAQAFNITDDNFPTTGDVAFVYMQDDAWAGVAQDHVKLWSLNMDWAAGNGTMSAAQTINTTPFISVFDGGSFSNLTQPGGSAIDALQATIMNQAQFRKFPGHNSAIFNFVVDTDASGGELAGIRWIELRQANDTAPWSLYQEGTYTAPNGKHAWMGCMAMDSQGNIGMGYSSMSGPTTPSTIRVSMYYTGRFANDPLGTMSISEELILEGNGNIPGTRYGDYGKLDVDPSNDKAFWFADEMMNSGRKDVVAVFQIAPNTVNDTGVISIDSPSTGSLGSNEDVIVTIFNYGDNAQSNIPLNLTVDGSIVATGTLSGSLASQTSAQYTFSGIDFSNEGHTYVVQSCTTLSGDEDAANDCVTQDIIHLNGSDIGVTEITNPTNGEGLGNESITVTIENFGGSSQSNFNVSYTLNGATPVTENVTGPVASGATLSYTFSTLGDFSATTTHTLSATTSLAGDADTSNDETSVTVVNVSCLSENNTTSQTIGPDANTITTSTISFTDDFIVNDVNVTLDITHTWNGDLEIKLVGPNNTEVILVNPTLGNVDNFTNTVFDDQATTALADGTPPFTGTFLPAESLSAFNGLQSAGDWDLVITDNAGGDGGTLNNWSLQLCGDITAAVSDNLFNDSDFVVSTLENNQFNVQVNTTEVTDRLEFTVTNMIGQKLLRYNINNENGGYSYDLDMSYATPGVYIIRLGNSKLGNTKKIVVK